MYDIRTNRDLFPSAKSDTIDRLSFSSSQQIRYQQSRLIILQGNNHRIKLFKKVSTSSYETAIWDHKEWFDIKKFERDVDKDAELPYEKDNHIH